MKKYDVGFIGDALERHRSVVEEIRRAGWRAVALGDHMAAIEAAPALILVELDVRAGSGCASVASIRALDDPVASVPIVALTARAEEPGVLRRIGVDDHLVMPCPTPQVGALLERWRPDEVAIAGLDRLSATFGEAQIVSLAGNLHGLLRDAVDALDGPGPEAVAHRVAGLAGTLGFADAGRAWLDVSRLGSGLSDDGWRQTRQALASIAAWRAAKRAHRAGEGPPVTDQTGKRGT